MTGDEKMAALLRWAEEIGVSDSPSSPPTSPSRAASCLGHSLSVSCFPNAGGRGLAAARDLREGEMVLRVPRSALLTRESVLRDEKLAAFAQRHPHLSPTQMLAVCLLAEVGKGRGSQWYPYLVQLPYSYDTLENFTQFEIQALQVEDAAWVPEKAVLKAKSDWKKALILMQEMELKTQLLTFRSWLWASATISSRTLHIPWDSSGCLCPVGDLFNYAAPDEEFFSEDLETTTESFHSNVGSFLKTKDRTEELDTDEQSGCYSKRLTDGGYEENTDSYCFYARKRYKKGEQVLLSYGTYTNLELLEHYGFLLNSNPNDKAFIHLTTEIYVSNSWPKDSLYIHPNGSPSFALLCALRLWATPMNSRRAFGHLAYTGSSLSNENELFVMKWLAKHCREILGRMPTSVENDESLLVTIDKVIEDASYILSAELFCFEGELIGFFQAIGLRKEIMVDRPLPTKAKKALQRWRLAVQWRLSHKRMLLNCISHCNKIIDKFSSACSSSKVFGAILNVVPE